MTFSSAETVEERIAALVRNLKTLNNISAAVTSFGYMPVSRYVHFVTTVTLIGGAFAKLRKATISFVISVVRPSACLSLSVLPHGTQLPLDGFS
jgi:hypothetical protein